MTGCSSSWMVVMARGMDSYANSMSPLAQRITWKVNGPSLSRSYTNNIGTSCNIQPNSNSYSSGLDCVIDRFDKTCSLILNKLWSKTTKLILLDSLLQEIFILKKWLPSSWWACLSDLRKESAWSPPRRMIRAVGEFE